MALIVIMTLIYAQICKCSKCADACQRETIFPTSLFSFPPIFTALLVMQTRYSDENSVRLSVCHTRVLRQNGRKICLHFYTTRKTI